MTPDPFEPSPDAVEAAAYSVRHQLELQGFQCGVLVQRLIARAALRSSIQSGAIVQRCDYDQALADERQRTDQWRRSWAAAVNDRDRLACRMQQALGEMGDRALATELAEHCGLMLPEGEANG